MKRFHVHLRVADLAGGIRFHTGLFAAEPGELKHDSAKWMLEAAEAACACERASCAPDACAPQSKAAAAPTCCVPR